MKLTVKKVQMKKFTIATIILIALTGCLQEHKYITDEEILSNYSLVDKVLVTPKEGHTTIVTYKGDTIYKGNVETFVSIPKSFGSARANDLEYHYVLENEKNKWYYLTSRQGLLLFEDLSNGDNDYNDFVCWIKEEIGVNLNGNGLITGLSMSNFQIRPLAMGNELPLEFGFEIRHLESGKLYFENIFSKDVRTDYFNGKKGFINTTDECKIDISTLPRDGHGIPTWSNPFRDNGSLAVNWFIVVGGEKRYLADSSLANIPNTLKDDRVPYGLFLPNQTENTFKWTKETISIGTAYPNFYKWTQGEYVNPFSNPNDNLLFDATE